MDVLNMLNSDVIPPCTLETVSLSSFRSCQQFLPIAFCISQCSSSLYKLLIYTFASRQHQGVLRTGRWRDSRKTLPREVWQLKQLLKRRITIPLDLFFSGFSYLSSLDHVRVFLEQVIFIFWSNDSHWTHQFSVHLLTSYMQFNQHF